MMEDIQRQEYIPVVTVIIPAYNAAQYIEETVKSVVNQTVTEWELIVVDDHSADETCEIVRQLAAGDRRIRLFCNEVNQGVAKTRNCALEQVRGQYVAFLDSDDIWYPDKLEKQLNLLKTECADFSYTSYRLVTAEENAWIGDYLVPEETSLKDMLGQNRIGCSTVLMRRELADRYRFSDEFYHEDYVLWLQMLRQGVKMVGLRDIMVDYRYSPVSRAGNKLASAMHRWQIYRGYLRLSWRQSVWYLLLYAVAGLKKYTNRGNRKEAR